MTQKAHTCTPVHTNKKSGVQRLQNSAHHPPSLVEGGGVCAERAVGECTPKKRTPRKMENDMGNDQKACRFLVVQIHPTAHPDDAMIQSNALTHKGVLLPMSADGFYANIEDAEGVAHWLRNEHPNIDVYVTEVVSKNGARQ